MKLKLDENLGENSGLSRANRIQEYRAIAEDVGDE